ncbi:hypothetical protein D3C81_09050 [compost metagenome]
MGDEILWVKNKHVAHFISDFEYNRSKLKAIKSAILDYLTFERDRLYEKTITYAEYQKNVAELFEDYNWDYNFVKIEREDGVRYAHEAKVRRGLGKNEVGKGTSVFCFFVYAEFVDIAIELDYYKRNNKVINF